MFACILIDHDWIRQIKLKPLQFSCIYFQLDILVKSGIWTGKIVNEKVDNFSRLLRSLSTHAGLANN